MVQPGHGKLPPGFQPRKQPQAHAEDDHGGGAHKECPGHGHDDPPPHVNWWQGILMVNNEKAQKPDAINRLLYRYENPNDPCDAKNQPPPFLATVLNFLVLGFVAYRFGKKPLAEALLKRKKDITSEIDAAQKLLKDAEERLERYQEEIDTIDDKRAQMHADFMAEAEAEKKHVLAEAEERKHRMRRDAEIRVEQESKAARAELLREAVEGAVVAAEELLAKRVASADQDKMAEEYLKNIGVAFNPSQRVGGASLGGRA